MVSSPPNSKSDFFDPTAISVRTIPLQMAKPLIVQNHYIHKWSPSKICFGVFESERLIGVAVYGHPVGRHVISGISPLLKTNEVLELKRFWIEDGHGRNIESFVIAQTFRLLKREMSQVKVLVSYADPAAGHVGTIYQATNWLFQALREDYAGETTFSFSLVPNPRPQDWRHSRSLGRAFHTHNIERLKQSIGRTFWIKPDSIKYRYLNFVCGKTEKRKILKSLKHPVSPYKKVATYDGQIREIVVTAKDFYGR